MISMDCQYIQLFNITMTENIGSDRLFFLAFSNMDILQSSFYDLISEPPAIFEISYSNLTMNNLNFTNFYPRLVYATGSGVNVSNCVFSNSTYIYLQNPMTVFYFEYQMQFIIENSTFDNLMNNLNGPVNKN